MANKFGEQLQAFARKTGEELEAVDRGFKFALFDRAVRATPVDTGRLRGNWQITNDTPAIGVLEVVDDSAEGSPLDPAGEALIRPFAVTYMVNNLPYALPMEARYGMVGRAVTNARAALRRAIAEND